MHRYYVSLPLLQGQPDRVGSVHRVPASEIEKLVIDALRRKFEVAEVFDQRDLIKTHLNRVEVRPKQLVIELKATTEKHGREAASVREIIQIPWTKPPSKRRREIIVPESKSTTDARPVEMSPTSKQ
jgi:site-specific DNA recombinase